MKARIVILAVTALSLYVVPANSQMSVDNSGRGFLGYTALPTDTVRTLNIACPDINSGLSVGNIFNIYTNNTSDFKGTYFTSNAGKYGMRMDNRGKIKIVTNEGDPSYNLDWKPGYNIEFPNNTVEEKYKDAALTIRTLGSRAIHVISGGGMYGGAVRSDVMSSSGIGLSVFNEDPHVMPAGREMVFFVNGFGEIYSYGGLIQTSDRTAKEDITPVDASALQKIDSLQAVTFKYKYGSSGKGRSAIAETSGVSQEIIAQRQSEQSRKRIGLIAQEVEKVIPEVVRTMEDGSKGIMYTDLIPLLIEGMKEQQAQISELRQQVTELQQNVANLENGNTNNSQNNLKNLGEDNSRIKSSIDGAELYQNRPNPFDGTTEIGYKVPQGASSAFIGIYNLSGKQIKKLPVQTGAGSITIFASELPAGIYIYSLIVDGSEVANKRMIAQ